MLDREREALIRAAVKAAAGLPVIVGTSHTGTQAALDLSQMAQELGADAVMVTPHAEAVPNDERVFEYYRTIAVRDRHPGGAAGPSCLQRRAHERAADAAHRRRAADRWRR